MGQITILIRMVYDVMEVDMNSKITRKNDDEHAYQRY